MDRSENSEELRGIVDAAGARIFAAQHPSVTLNELRLESRIPVVTVISYEGAVDMLLEEKLIRREMIARNPRRVRRSWDPDDTGFWETRRKANDHMRVLREIGNEVSDSDVLARFAPKHWPLIGSAAEARCRIEEDTNRSLDDMIGTLWGLAGRIRNREQNGLRVSLTQQEMLSSIVAQCCDELEALRVQLKVERTKPIELRIVK